jgi:hypothetical protein
MSFGGYREIVKSTPKSRKFHFYVKIIELFRKKIKYFIIISIQSHCFMVGIPDFYKSPEKILFHIVLIFFFEGEHKNQNYWP